MTGIARPVGDRTDVVTDACLAQDVEDLPVPPADIRRRRPIDIVARVGRSTGGLIHLKDEPWHSG